MKKTFALLVVLGLVILGLAIPAGADSNARPFKANFSGEVSWTLDASCPVTSLRTNSAATGNATHMGLTVMSSSHCTPVGLDYGLGEMVLTAANRAQITMQYGGTCPPFADLEVGDLLACTVDFDVTGGTGRFVDAGGHGSGSVTIVWQGIEAPVMPASWVLEGTLGY